MSKDQPRLGRGLSSLINPTGRDLTSPTVASPSPGTAVPAEAVPHSGDAIVPTTGDQLGATVATTPAGRTVLRELPISLVRPNPQQPRRDFDPVRVQALADSLKNNGALQPIVVRPAGDGYQLVAGERRWRAAQLAKLETLPAIVRETTDNELLELALIENVQREDLNAIERAQAYLNLARQFQLTHDEIARRLGEDRSNVSNYIRLLDLDDDILDFVRKGRLTMGHARSLLAVADTARRSNLARQAADEGWSVRAMEEQVKAVSGQSTVARAAAKAVMSRPLIADWERRLSEALGLRVRIVEGRRQNAGRVIIEYHGVDDFDRVTGRLGVQAD